MTYLDGILELPKPILKIIIQNLLMVTIDFEKLSNVIVIQHVYDNRLITFLNELVISKENRNLLNEANKRFNLGINMKGNPKITVDDIEEYPELIRNVKIQDITPEMITAFKRKSKIQDLLLYFDLNFFNLKLKEHIVRYNVDMIKHFRVDLDFFKRVFDLNKNVIKVDFDFPMEIQKFIVEKEIFDLKNSLANQERKMDAINYILKN